MTSWYIALGCIWVTTAGIAYGIVRINKGYDVNVDAYLMDEKTDSAMCEN